MSEVAREIREARIIDRGARTRASCCSSVLIVRGSESEDVSYVVIARIKFIAGGPEVLSFSRRARGSGLSPRLVTL